MAYIIHKSQYEEEGWISIKDRLPEENTLVKVAKIRMLDWNLETLEWETLGRHRVFNNQKETTWSIKYVNGITNGDTKPTHWMPRHNEELEEIRKFLNEK